jgi:hypothetical protein
MKIITLSQQTFAETNLTDNFSRTSGSGIWRRTKTYDTGGIYKAGENLGGGVRDGDLLQCLGTKDDDGQVFNFLKVEKMDKGGYAPAASKPSSADTGIREVQSEDFESLRKVDQLALLTGTARLTAPLPVLPGRPRVAADTLKAHFWAKDFRPASVLIRPTAPGEYAEIPDTLQRHQDVVVTRPARDSMAALVGG